jgi:hypothetical protein
MYTQNPADSSMEEPSAMPSKFTFEVQAPVRAAAYTVFFPYVICMFTDEIIFFITLGPSLMT